jgi:hypothetical protein
LIIPVILSSCQSISHNLNRRYQLSRTHKTGLDYFSFDVDFFDDPKIEFISARFDEIGELITIKLLCRIYRDGYYMQWSDDDSVLFAKRAGVNITKSMVDDVVNELLKRGFFDEKIFKKYKILTSNGIQRRYLEATKRRKEINVYKELLIADTTNYDVNIIKINVDINKQSKVKESKGNKSKVNISLPKDFSISDRVIKWAKEKGHTRIEEHFENFVMAAESKNYKYADWDLAFMRAIRDNWAKLEKNKPHNPTGVVL